LLIRDWRTRWGRDDLPIGWVQLPNFDTTTRTPQMAGWPLVREGQLLARSLPHTGMAVTIDIGEPNSIHPRNKQAFSHRLALWARAEVYGEKVSWSGPLYSSHKVVGRAVELCFHHTDGGLVAPGAVLKGFQVAGADKRWRPHWLGLRRTRCSFPARN
jgi:sialate O-acetylesterase